jgi:hypothetical protein
VTINGNEVSQFSSTQAGLLCSRARLPSVRVQCKLGSDALPVSPMKTASLFSTACLHSRKISSLFALNVHSYGAVLKGGGVVAPSLRNGCKETLFKFLTSEASLMTHHIMKINRYNLPN